METEFLKDFIELYKSCPCLWKVNSPEYSNERLKNQCYEELVQLLQTVEPNATKASVLRKLNGLRCTFKMELKKVMASKNSGLPPDLVYQPKLWYFDSLMFLCDTETENDEENRMVLRLSDDDLEADYDDGVAAMDAEDLLLSQPLTSLLNQPLDPPLNQPLNPPLNQPINQPLNPPLNQPLNQPLNPPLNQPLNPPLNQPLNPPLNQPLNPPLNQPLNPPLKPQLSPQTLKRKGSTAPNSEHNGGVLPRRPLDISYETSESTYVMFGKYVAERLEDLDSKSPDSCAIVRKLICDAIFEGETGTLRRISRIVSPPEGHIILQIPTGELHMPAEPMPNPTQQQPPPPPAKLRIPRKSKIRPPPPAYPHKKPVTKGSAHGPMFREEPQSSSQFFISSS